MIRPNYPVRLIVLATVFMMGAMVSWSLALVCAQIVVFGYIIELWIQDWTDDE